ncbi:MAG: OmpH family outer membrane protein [Acidobacteriota bacterium]|jgi:Skp family chaperone for outer membrane proteins
MSRKATLLLGILLALPVLGAAQNPPQNPPATPPPPAPQAAAPVVIGPAKIAFVSIQQAIANCDEGKREAAILGQYVEQKNAENIKLQKEVETLKNQLDIQGSKLSDDARADLSDQIDLKDTNLQRFQQDTQKDIENRRQKLQNMIGRKMLPVIEKVAKEKGVDVVQFVDVANVFGYVSPSLVITDDIVKAYNVAYPAAAAPAPIKK